jgi:DNA repair exonuclease SbcCD ATPase subunit
VIADLEEDLARCMAQLKQASTEYDKLLKQSIMEETELTEKLTEAAEELKLAKMKSAAAANASASGGGGGGAETEQLKQELQMAEAKIAKLSAAAKSAAEAEELREKLAAAEAKTVSLQAAIDKQKGFFCFDSARFFSFFCCRGRSSNHDQCRFWSLALC